jgi:RHS repeat-associated protein
LRLTENLGFDAVYYSYNSMNKITSVHTVDARGQHATFYGYDEEGRVFRMWTATSERGFGPSMAPRKPELVSRPYAGAAGAEFSYDPLNAVTKIDYPQLNMSTTHSYNDAGMLLRSTTTLQGAAQPVHDEALWYSQSGLITDKLTREGANWPREVYVYDKVGRLTTVAYHPLRTYDNYQYDRAGNRTYSLSSPNDALIQGRSLTYTHTPGANHLTRVSSEPLPVGQVPQFMDEMTYDPDGSMIARTKNRAEDGLRQQKIETFGYDAFNLIHVYNVQTATTTGAEAACAPNASLAPVEQWRYRFGLLQEREQKRQYASARGDTTLAWVYTLLGADGKQLATYNGLQGALCGGNQATLQIWPVEFNAYGPANTRLITRADGRTEYVVSDYLGSARVTLSTSAEPLQSSSYHPYGTERTSSGSGARTSYICREHDNETDLGFYGVRLYEPEYGRFLSTDVLWAKYLPLQPYQYAGNEPVGNYDNNGKEIVPINLTAEEKESMKMVISYLRSRGDFGLNSILYRAESCQTTIHVYSMPDTRNYVQLPHVSKLSGLSELLEDRFYDDNRWGITLQTDQMAAGGSADVILNKAMAGIPSVRLLVTLIDELNHATSPGINGMAEIADHKSIFLQLLQLHDKGIIKLTPEIYKDLVDRLKELGVTPPEDSQELPQQPGSTETPSVR